MLKLWTALALSLLSFSAQANDLFAISAGSSTAIGSYAADSNFTGGTIYSANVAIDTSHVANPAPAAVYDNCRFGNFSYTFQNLAAGAIYVVRLHFAEIYFNAAGQRSFNVAINGNQVLSNFDIFAVSGGQGIANVQQFQAPADANGRLVISFINVVENAQVNGIEIQGMSDVPTPTPTPSYNLSLSSGQPNYAAGTTGTILGTMSALPTNPNEEFFVSATFMGSPIALTWITKSQFYAITPALSAGATTFTAQVYQQDAKAAAALNSGIRYYQGEIAKYQAELAVSTDPTEIATLNAKIEHDQARLDATKAELSRIRTPVGNPVNISILAH